LSYDLNEKQYVYKPITKIWEKGLLQGSSVGLKNGQHVDVSDGQPMWARTNQRFVHGKKVISKYEKRYFKDIDLSRWWKRRLPIVKKLPYQVNDIEWLTEDLCFIVGHYLAEGWKEGGHVCSSGYDITDRVLPLLNKTTIPYSEYKNNSGVPCIRFLKSDFKEFLKTLKCSSFDIHLPEELFHLSENKLRAILDGYWVGDGHNGNYPPKTGCAYNKQEVYSTSSIQWAADLQRIGLQLGESFHVWKQTNHQGVGTKPIYRITKNTNSHFYHDHGYEGLSEIGIARKHIENIGLVEMRDFEVADTHTFIFKNGLVCHQCEDFALTKAKKLLDMGYPASALHIEVGTIPGGEGHAWLVVQTDQGDYALDNIFKPIMKNTLLPYSGRKRQTGSNWINKGVKLSDVTIEYMDGVNSDAFEIDDRVVVAFTDQDWNKPKVIGFESNPKPGYAMLSFINNAYVDPRKIRKYKISGEFIEDIPTTISNNAQVTMASNKLGAAVYVVFNDLFGTHMTLTIDRYTPAGKTSIVYDLWQGYISTYFAAITKDYCSVHDMGEAFFDDYGLIYIPLAIYGGEFFIYALVGFIVVNPADGSLAGEYWHNYGGSIYFYPNAPTGGFVANNNVYLADISDGSTGYPIIRILDNNNYALLNTISLSGKIYGDAYAVHATTEKIYAVYPSSSGTILKIFNQATNVLLSTYTLSISEALWPPNIFVVGSSLYIVLTINASTTVFVFDLSGNLKSTIDIGYTEYESSFTLASANII
jgi:hypothetical protein